MFQLKTQRHAKGPEIISAELIKYGEEIPAGVTVILPGHQERGLRIGYPLLTRGHEPAPVCGICGVQIIVAADHSLTCSVPSSGIRVISV